MGGKRWTEAEDEFLARNAGKMTHRDLAESMGRSTKSVERRIHKLDLYQKVASNRKEAEGRREQRMELVVSKVKKGDRIMGEGMLAKVIRKKAQKYLDDGQELDLSEELAQMRAIRDITIEWAEEGEIDPGKLNFVMIQAERVGNMVERIVRIMSNTALTQAEVKFIQIRIVEIITKYVPPELKDACIREIVGALGVR